MSAAGFLGFGVALQSFGIAEPHLFCIVNVAEDAGDAGYMMLSGNLKLGILSHPRKAKLVRSTWQWQILAFLHRRKMLPGSAEGPLW